MGLTLDGCTAKSKRGILNFMVTTPMPFFLQFFDFNGKEESTGNLYKMLRKMLVNDVLPVFEARLSPGGKRWTNSRT